jgi:ComF family protein
LLQNNTNIKESIIASLSFDILDFIAPKVCLVCDSKITINDNKHKYLCIKCLNNLPYYINYSELLNRLILKFGLSNLGIRRANALLDISKNENYLNVIYSFKYNQLQDSAIEFGIMLGKKLLRDDFSDYDAIIPLPIHHARKRERGYNQAHYIAKGVSQVLNIKLEDKYVKRIRYTSTQTKLNASQREINLANAFRADSIVASKRLLLIDDVLTTGATLNNCAVALKSSFAEYIDVAAIAAK